MTAQIPARKPARPFFSSGPCAKPPGYSLDKLATESLGRSHRAKIGKTRLAYCIDLMREVLGLPDTHRIGIVPGSDTEWPASAMMCSSASGNSRCRAQADVIGQTMSYLP